MNRRNSLGFLRGTPKGTISTVLATFHNDNHSMFPTIGQVSYILVELPQVVSPSILRIIPYIFPVKEIRLRLK